MYEADPSLQTPVQTPVGLTALDMAASNGHETIVDLIHAVEPSQSSSTSSVLKASEIAANVDSEMLNVLNCAMQKMLDAKVETFIFHPVPKTQEDKR